MHWTAFRELILYEDNHLLVVNKPTGLLSQGDITGEKSLFSLAKSYLKEAYKKPGNVYLGLVHRLDRVTSGVVVLAKTSKAARRLVEQFKKKEVVKTYLAVVRGDPPNYGRLEGYLLYDDFRRKVLVFWKPRSGAKEASLEFRVLRKDRGQSLLEVRPLTGRKHQIRALLASAGWPIVGDRRYGLKSGGPILLHAFCIELVHPVRKEKLLFIAPLPGYWPPRLRPEKEG
ncbi:23S rRNA pseudouridine1911/1915/1917 synthase [Thermosulfuriphilus ammonigenes]|uniref:RluA family pseudouridine synthase n=1 Tax=Thermosulfuriphilus ammonigenes TaxID=1936021 RepID=UPI00181ADDE5|nr:RluA family pseudouridine synthase [Thermosulfuriphilus ammonigenes]MBA2849776.1 23S rRNA pseudouridine1911/1915/1917 synthase [Thermosulfuriphilus ammonigenes]